MKDPTGENAFLTGNRLSTETVLIFKQINDELTSAKVEHNVHWITNYIEAKKKNETKTHSFISFTISLCDTVMEKPVRDSSIHFD